MDLTRWPCARVYLSLYEGDVMIVTDVMSFVAKTVFHAAFVVNSDEEGNREELRTW